MSERLLVDTGILVAAIDRRDSWADSVVERFKLIRGPLITCEPVLAETWFLLQKFPPGWETVVKWIDHGFLKIQFSISERQNTVFNLMKKYKDLPMSLADASLVCMVEDGIGDRIFTLDEHFRIYRQSNRRSVPVLLPK